MPAFNCMWWDTEQLEDSTMTYLCAQELFYITDGIGLDNNTELSRNWLPAFTGIFSGKGKTQWWEFWRNFPEDSEWMD